MKRLHCDLILNMHVKLLNSFQSYFDFPSDTTSNMASKVLAIELWVGRRFKVEIFCSNVYADDYGTTILEPVE